LAKSADIAAKQLIATDQIAGNYKLLAHRYALDHTKKEVAVPVDITLNADGTVTGTGTGTWSTTEGKSYFTIKLGSDEYKGVMVLQTLEPTNKQVPAFTCLNQATGITVWGYKVTE
jgi:arabinan endo-1,5-alpha-L-arabinosidase